MCYKKDLKKQKKKHFFLQYIKYGITSELYVVIWI